MTHPYHFFESRFVNQHRPATFRAGCCPHGPADFILLARDTSQSKKVTCPHRPELPRVAMVLHDRKNLVCICGIVDVKAQQRTETIHDLIGLTFKFRSHFSKRFLCVVKSLKEKLSCENVQCQTRESPSALERIERHLQPAIRKHDLVA